MSLSLIGVSHRNAPLALREKLAVLRAAELLERLRRDACSEAVVLQTCNRFELYAVHGAERPHSWLHDFLEEVSGLSLSEHVYQRRGPAAVEHLFKVSSGLDSLVVGETEILGQVRASYDAAKAAGMTGKYCNVLFQRALYVGKKVRSDTAITVGQTSVASVAVQLAARIFGSLSSSSVLILGAGAMAELTARHLLSQKVPRLFIANRTFERGEALAKQLNALAIRWEDFPSRLAEVDIVIASTGSDKPVVTAATASQAAAARAGRSLFMIDIAMPRDIEEEVHALEHVYVYRLADLESIVADNLKSRAGEVAAAHDIVKAKAAEFSAWEDSVAAGKEISLKHSEARS